MICSNLGFLVDLAITFHFYICGTSNIVRQNIQMCHCSMFDANSVRTVQIMDGTSLDDYIVR